MLRLGRQSFDPSRLLAMAVVSCGPPGPAAAMERVQAAAAEGAAIIEVSAGPDEEADQREEIIPFVAAVCEAYPELVVGVRTGRREVAREACAAGVRLLGGPGGPDGPEGSDGSGLWLAEVAAEFGAGLVGPLAWTARAVEAGVGPERIVVPLPDVGQLASLVATGWPVLVSPADGDLATTAVAAWLGARVFRVHQVQAARRVLSMVSAIRGDIPPAYAVRGLA
jgi:dihydropteroate synthase